MKWGIVRGISRKGQADLSIPCFINAEHAITPVMEAFRPNWSHYSDLTVRGLGLAFARMCTHGELWNGCFNHSVFRGCNGGTHCAER